jgi:ketosteroid isomerase-like protein
MTTPESARARDDARRRHLSAEPRRALGAQDLDRRMPPYAAAVVVFDAEPPFQTPGAGAFRRTRAACLPYFPDACQTEGRDLRLTVSGDVALAHWLWRFTGMATDHLARQTLLRSPAGSQRLRGRWQIVHEHASVPFKPETGHATFTLDPQSNT